MTHRRHLNDHESRRFSNRNNASSEDARRRFHDQNYDNYFPKQNYLHPKHEESRSSQYGMESQFGRGMQQDYGSRYSGQQDQNLNSRKSNQSWSPSNFERGSEQSWSPSSYEEGPLPTANSFYGKGPKGFKRSDERIKEEVSEALYCDSRVDASEIEVRVHDGEITLSGTVENRHMKRLAEDCVESASGVSDIRNELRVQSSSSRTSRAEESTAMDRSDKSDKLKNKNTNSNKLI